MSSAIHATTTTVGAVKSATITTVDAKPNAIKYTVFGDSEAGAAISLARRMLGEGYDPQMKISVPVLGNIAIERLA
jgi:hypothetical protein